MRLACVTGRFQPVHNGHLELFAAAIAEHDLLIVAVTNPDPEFRALEDTAPHRHRDDANPFTYYERYRLLTAALRCQGLAGRAAIVPFDLARPGCWANYVPLSATQFVRVFTTWERTKARRLSEGGYRVVALVGDPATKLSATTVRAALRTGQGWERYVPAGVADVLRTMPYRTRR
ncbi:adenylyltransferase/cytidyltransferase family protein [Actinoallomurus sp. NPDC050550]|uniref:adenylyltransferase/cytidyltransferase family protein n=1 Tax=Actinoallomurus sp. NPDC050550 TaxID=3154937 RepID=UPI0033D83E3A